MSAAERQQFLTNYPPTRSAQILEKIQEYQIMPPDLRELRLRVTELRWYLLPLMKTPPTNRVAQLRLIPERCRSLVAERLEQWDILPPPLKEETLEYQTTIQYFVGRDYKIKPPDAVPSPDLGGDVPQDPELEQKLKRWQALPLAQRQQMYAQFQHFFNFTDTEKQKTLETLSQSEQQQAEKALDPIEKWPKSEREKYIAAFRQFADMSPSERQQFWKNAERWRKMSPAERQAWRDLVQKLSQLPPLPPGVHLQPDAAVTNGD